MSSFVRPGRGIAAAGILVIMLASCGHAATHSSTNSRTDPSDGVSLAGWSLTLPVAGPNGDAEVVNPAAITAPWLTNDSAGDLVFWAPVAGTTTSHSEHPRTELVDLTGFTAGTGGTRTLSATVAVNQLPNDTQNIIIGQIHGGGSIDSVPFVMLRYEAGTVAVVVKQEQSGDSKVSVPLLSGVPLNAVFQYTITDDGSGTLTFSATYGSTTVTHTASVPAAFAGQPVRFQAGDYQQDDASSSAPSTDGGRVTFSALSATVTG
jgi:hypothetical protein